jgi:type I restriction enzyme S subunit
MSWPMAPLGDVAELLNGDRGKHYPSRAFRVEHGVPFVNAGHLVDGHIRFDDMDYITEEHFARLGGGKVRDRDILLCIRGSLGRVAMAGPGDVPAAIASSLMILRPNPAIDAAFLLFFLSSPAGQAMVAARDNGAAQPNIGARDVAKLRVPLPPLSTQRKIAASLSAYDDLIEKNRRRIKLLEEMVQCICHEWFVDFRYPGHDDVPQVDSAIGLIPDGWRIGELSDCASVSKKTLTPGDRPLETFRHFSIPAFDASQMPELAAGSTILSNKFLVEEPSVLYSKLNPRIPRVWWADPSPQYVSVASTELLVMTPRPGWSRAWLRAVLADDEFTARAAAMAGGTSTSHQRVKPGDLLALHIALPPMHLVDQFSVLAEKLFGLTAVLRSQNDVARGTRELLLPRLVSGELDVEQLDISVEEAVA